MKARVIQYVILGFLGVLGLFKFMPIYLMSPRLIVPVLIFPYRID
jgi:hypothetical protein